MSAPLYLVTVLDVGPAKASFNLVSVCEAGCFTLSRLFAASLLYEPFWTDLSSATGARWPRPVTGWLSTQFTADELCNWGAAGAPPHEEPRLRAITDVAYGALRNIPSLTTTPDPDGLYRRGLRHAEGAAFIAASRAFHRAIDPSYLRMGPKRLAGLPAAVLHVAASDSRWLAHLEPGMMWDGYGFDDSAPVVI